MSIQADSSQELCDAINAFAHASSLLAKFEEMNKSELSNTDRTLLEISFKLSKTAFELLFKIGRPT